MRTITKTVYSFSELSESAKENAVSELSNINLDYGWWEGTYEDANRISLEITSFGLDRDKHCKGEVVESCYDTANKIMVEHGESCDTYKLAESFIRDYNSLVEKYSDGVNLDVVAEDNEYEFDKEAGDLEEEFKSALLEEYASILQNEYEYLYSDEAIIETIEANEYEFDEEGNLV